MALREHRFFRRAGIVVCLGGAIALYADAMLAGVLSIGIGSLLLLLGIVGRYRKGIVESDSQCRARVVDEHDEHED